MRISDWSSDVCSSDLLDLQPLDVVLLHILHDFLNQFVLVRTVRIEPEHRRHARIARTRHGQLHPIANRRVLGLAHRSEEHTSELQSLMRISYAVFCLKKKNTTNTNTHAAHTTHKH